MNIKDRRGSLTLETAIIIVPVFLVILLLFYMTNILYEQVRLNAIAEEVAEKGAIIFTDSTKDIITGRFAKEDLSEEWIYWRLFDFKKQEKIEKISDYLAMKLSKYRGSSKKYYTQETSKIDGKNIYIAYGKYKYSVDVENYVLLKKINIKIETE